jgi:hypothetical protein
LNDNDNDCEEDNNNRASSKYLVMLFQRTKSGLERDDWRWSAVARETKSETAARQNYFRGRCPVKQYDDVIRCAPYSNIPLKFQMSDKLPAELPENIKVLSLVTEFEAVSRETSVNL